MRTENDKRGRPTNTERINRNRDEIAGNETAIEKLREECKSTLKQVLEITTRLSADVSIAKEEIADIAKEQKGMLVDWRAKFEATEKKIDDLKERTTGRADAILDRVIGLENFKEKLLVDLQKTVEVRDKRFERVEYSIGDLRTDLQKEISELRKELKSAVGNFEKDMRIEKMNRVRKANVSDTRLAKIEDGMKQMQSDFDSLAKNSVTQYETNYAAYLRIERAGNLQNWITGSLVLANLGLLLYMIFS